MTDLHFCQDNKSLFDYGIISRRGDRDNKTDCEVDIILIHVPSGKLKRFQGTFYNDNYVKNLCNWIRSFPKSNKGITTEKLNYYYSESLYNLLRKNT